MWIVISEFAARLWVSALALVACGDVAFAQTGYKYRDANGQWVFTDSAPPSGAKTDSSFNLAHQSETLKTTIERTDNGRTTTFTAINTCLCVATFREQILHSDDPDIADGTEFRKILQPQSRELLTRVENAGQANPSLNFRWEISLGSPEAKHKPPAPYRAPFAIGSSYRITQAFPDTFTHGSPDARYAVDIALPDGTPVYAARDGVVINVRHDAFLGGASAVMMDQANLVAVLHDDGTIALYGHLHWDSIRVHIGQHVIRGEALANSGNTGFTTGPHLHFVVTRNAGFTTVSVPVEFAGPANVPVTPSTGKMLTAY